MSGSLIIFIKDNNNETNYKLMAFLHNNIKITTSYGNRIIPRIIPKFQEKKFYSEYKIDKLPASLYNKQKYIGHDSIKDLIKLLCKNKKTLRTKNEDELATEELLQHNKFIIDSGDNAEEDNDIENRKMQAAVITRQRMESINESNTAPEMNYYKDMEAHDDGDLPMVSDRHDNITEQGYGEIQNIAHENENDDQYMDALLEKIRGANADYD